MVKYETKVVEKTFVVYDENMTQIHVYMGTYDKDSISDEIITLDKEIKDEKEFHTELSYWMMDNQ
jgi:predicted nucleotidyltransferase